MPSLSIKNVPQPIVEGLRRRAKQNHRSMQGELLDLISTAVGKGVEPGSSSGAISDYQRPPSTPLDEHLAELKERWKTEPPVTRGPYSVDIIREARDAR